MSTSSDPRTVAVGVVIPVHNEQALLPGALHSLERAWLMLETVEVNAAVCLVLDSCTDQSERIVRRWRRHCVNDGDSFEVHVRTLQQRNVGMARATGCTALLELWPHLDPARTWLATTDADSSVPSDWLTSQVMAHEQGVDLWSGRVTIAASSERDVTVAKWRRDYETEVHPVHGTNLGCNAASYLAAGGFAPLTTGEDLALRQSLVELGARVRYDSSVRVLTSARRNARSPLGFAHALDVIEASLISNVRN